MNKAAIVAVAAIASLLAFQPALAQAPAMFMLFVQSEGTGFGSILSSPNGVGCPANEGIACGQYFPANSQVALTAVPEANSVLASWGGACTGNGICIVTMDAHKTVIATINARPGTNYLKASTFSDDGVGNGSVVSSPSGLSCDNGLSCRANFPSQAVVALNPLPKSGAKLSSWGGACSGAGTCQVTMSAPRTVYANFAVEAPERLNFTSLWWDPSESGWGVNLNHQGNTLFATLFTYDESGSPLWLSMSGGTRLGQRFYYEGDLYRTTGSPLNVVPFVPVPSANYTKVGRMWVSFVDFDRANFGFSVNGAWVTKTIQKFLYGTRAASCSSLPGSRAASVNYQDLWWTPEESGWGINFTHQDDTLFGTFFTYDATGRDLWLVMSEGRKQADGSFFGELYRTRGPPFNAKPFTPIGPGDYTLVGSMRASFSDGEHGTLTYTYNGIAVTKAITRYAFANTVPMCY